MIYITVASVSPEHNDIQNGNKCRTRAQLYIEQYPVWHKSTMVYRRIPSVVFMMKRKTTTGKILIETLWLKQADIMTEEMEHYYNPIT